MRKLSIPSLMLKLPALVALGALSVSNIGRAATTNLNVYMDSLGTNWQFGGWSSTNYNTFRTVYSGSYAVQTTQNAAWSAFAFERRASNWSATYPIAASEYAYVEFDINVAGTPIASAKTLELYLDNGSTGKALTNYIVGGIKNYTWQHVKIPVKEVNNRNASYYRVAVRNASSSKGFTFYLDNVRLTVAPVATPTPTPKPAPTPTPTPKPITGWLATSGNHIVRSDGSIWMGRGANLHDTRSCGNFTLTSGAPLHDDEGGINEVKRRIDMLTGTWKANFIRLVLESRRPQDNYIASAAYRSAIQQIVNYIGTKPNVYVLVSVWMDPSLDSTGWPTDTTNQILAQLARDFYGSKHVMYGVSNEPQDNWDGALDAQVWTRMNSAVAAIRAAEASLGSNRHIVTVQGTRDWARNLNYYLTRPIAAGNGVNVAYETHIYNNPSEFSGLLAPAASLPVILGEIGPVRDAWHNATASDMQTLINLAESAKTPYAAWTFHEHCLPNLFGERVGMTWDQNSTIDPGAGIIMNPTDWGQLLMRNLQRY